MYQALSYWYLSIVREMGVGVISLECLKRCTLILFFKQNFMQKPQNVWSPIELFGFLFFPEENGLTL